MPRDVFFSFHHQLDVNRVHTIRGIDTIKGNLPLRDSDWEAITHLGDKAIEAWIDSQMTERSCAIVFVGAKTARRKWIDYEIKRAWDLGLGVFGIYVHRILNSQKQPSARGSNPFAHMTFQGAPFSSVMPCHDPAGFNSTSVFDTIAESMDGWIDTAIAIRKRYVSAPAQKEDSR